MGNSYSYNAKDGKKLVEAFPNDFKIKMVPQGNCKNNDARNVVVQCTDVNPNLKTARNTNTCFDSHWHCVSNHKYKHTWCKHDNQCDSGHCYNPRIAFHGSYCAPREMNDNMRRDACTYKMRTTTQFRTETIKKDKSSFSLHTSIPFPNCHARTLTCGGHSCFQWERQHDHCDHDNRTVETWHCNRWPHGWMMSNDVIDACKYTAKKQGLKGEVRKSWQTAYLSSTGADGCYNRKYPHNFHNTVTFTCADGKHQKNTVECTDWPGGWTQSGTCEKVCAYSLAHHPPPGMPKNVKYHKSGFAGMDSTGSWMTTKASGCHFAIIPQEEKCLTGGRSEHVFKCINWPKGWMMSKDVVHKCNAHMKTMMQQHEQDHQKPILEGFTSADVCTEDSKTNRPDCLTFKGEGFMGQDAMLRVDVAGLKWDDIGTTPPPTGQDLKNARASEHLAHSSTYTLAERRAQGLDGVALDAYVKASNGHYYRPNIAGYGCWNRKYPHDFVSVDHHWDCKKNGKLREAWRTVHCDKWPTLWFTSKHDDVLASCIYNFEKARVGSLAHLKIPKNVQMHKSHDGLGGHVHATWKEADDGCYNLKHPKNFTNTDLGLVCEHGKMSHMRRMECTDWPSGWMMSGDVMDACNYSLKTLQDKGTVPKKNKDGSPVEYKSHGIYAGLTYDDVSVDPEKWAQTHAFDEHYR